MAIKKISLIIAIAISPVLTSISFSQEVNRRYTFIAKDGSKIINALLLHEEKDIYIVQIGDNNQKITISKRDIEKLTHTDPSDHREYIPVIGKTANPQPPAVTVKPVEKNTTDNETSEISSKKNLDMSLDIYGYLISKGIYDSGHSSSGWGAGFAPLLSYKKINFLRIGIGMDHYRISSSIQDREIEFSMITLYGELQLSYIFNAGRENVFQIRPLLGFSYGGSFYYISNISKPASEENDNSDLNIDKYSLGSFYSLRPGIGVRFPSLPFIEIILSARFLNFNKTFIDNFTTYSLGINYYFD